MLQRKNKPRTTTSKYIGNLARRIMVAEEIVIVLSGGGPWGFRLQGGLEQQKPLQVAKVSEQPTLNRWELRRSWPTGVLHGRFVVVGSIWKKEIM